MEAHVLTINDFNVPKVFKNADANYMHIIYLLLLEPGKIQSHPTMGIGLRSRYRFNNAPNILTVLEDDIKSQLETYLPDLKNTDIVLDLDDNHILSITIITPEGVYQINYNTNTEDIILPNSKTTYINNI